MCKHASLEHARFASPIRRSDQPGATWAVARFHTIRWIKYVNSWRSYRRNLQSFNPAILDFNLWIYRRDWHLGTWHFYSPIDPVFHNIVGKESWIVVETMPQAKWFADINIIQEAMARCFISDIPKETHSLKGGCARFGSAHVRSRRAHGFEEGLIGRRYEDLRYIHSALALWTDEECHFP